MRGIFQAVYWRELAENAVGPKDFDLISGTSTGAIIAAWLACGKNPVALVELFTDEGEKIFEKARSHYFTGGSRYTGKRLVELLNEEFADRTMSQTDVPLLIPAATLDRFGHRLFNSHNHPTHKVADVVRASGAAPTYFPPVKPVGDDVTYVDGGLWANSPALAAVVYAQTELHVPIADIRVLSIGNGYSPQGMRPKDLADLRPVGVTAIRTLFELMFASQESSTRAFVERLIGSQHHMYVNEALQTPIALDHVTRSVEDLPALASNLAQVEGPLSAASVAERVALWKEESSSGAAAAPQVERALESIRADVLARPWLREHEETITVRRVEPGEDLLLQHDDVQIFECSVHSIRRGVTAPDEAVIAYCIEPFEPKIPVYYLGTLGKGLFSADAYDEIRKGVRMERLQSFIRGVTIRIRDAQDHVLDYIAEEPVLDDGVFLLKFRRPAAASPERFNILEIAIRKYIAASSGWYTFYSRFTVTERLSVHFHAPFRVQVKRNLIPRARIEHDNEALGDEYRTTVIVDGPVMPERPIDFVFLPS
ncbi:MAG TPA: patatin-like phospholipase family protein [Thermoanaerobaculia bacterium]|nr:patatin-like phospholipase family protein [Thermoanaerobaculia bacterium]